MVETSLCAGVAAEVPIVVEALFRFVAREPRASRG